MLLKYFGIVASSLLLLSAQALATSQPIIEELLTANRTLGGRVVAYPEGTPEMRVYRITIPVGAKIPLHIHPSPVVVIVEQGRLSNVASSMALKYQTSLRQARAFLKAIQRSSTM